MPLDINTRAWEVFENEAFFREDHSDGTRHDTHVYIEHVVI